MLQIKTLPNKMNSVSYTELTELIRKFNDSNDYDILSNVLKSLKFTSPKYSKEKYYLIVDKIFVVITTATNIGSKYLVEFYKTDKQGNVTHYYFNDSIALIPLLLENLPNFIKNSKK